MLSKEDLKKKKGESGQQLDFVESVTTANNIKKKRLSIFIFLFLTVGVSLVFLLYNKFKNQQLFIKLPQINIKISDIIPKPNPIAHIISVDPNSWQVCLFDLSTSKKVFDHHCPLTSIPVSLPSTPSTILKSSLPNGLEIKENIITQNNSIDFSAVITSPIRRLLLVIKIFGSSPLSGSQKLIPEVAQALYWRFSTP